MLTDFTYSHPELSSNASGYAGTRKAQAEALGGWQGSNCRSHEKRWAAVHKAEKTAPKKAPAKKRMSPARKAALVANLAKARAARAAKRTATSA